nr:hypothetical protein [Bacteroidota bacterium]
MPTIKRIVVAESTNDTIAFNRITEIHTNLKLKEFTVSFVYAVDQVAENLPFSILPRIEENLFSRIKAQVAHSNPQLLLIYTGFVFKQFPEQYYTAIRRIKTITPDLLVGRFGADTSTAKNAPDDIFDRTQEVMSVESLFYNEFFVSKEPWPMGLDFGLSLEGIDVTMH